MNKLTAKDARYLMEVNRPTIDLILIDIRMAACDYKSELKVDLKLHDSQIRQLVELGFQVVHKNNYDVITWYDTGL